MKFELVRLILLLFSFTIVRAAFTVYPPRYELSDAQHEELLACLAPTGHDGDIQSKYDPICGTDGFSYYNKYQMRCVAKAIPSVDFAFYGRCPNEPLFLPLESARGTELLGNPAAFQKFQRCLETCSAFDPVCGTDQKSYTSACALQCAKAHRPKLAVKYAGFCREDMSAAENCPAILQPFCGSDGITYLNFCHFQYVQRREKDLLPAHMGDCVRRLITVQGAAQKKSGGGCGCGGGGGGGCGGCGK